MIDATVVRLTQTCAPGRGIRRLEVRSHHGKDIRTRDSVFGRSLFPLVHQGPALTRTVHPLLQLGIHLHMRVCFLVIYRS